MKNGLALVIGNVQYALPNLQLVNAVNDAKAVSRKLTKLGFVVINLNDCTTEKFDRTLQEFGEQLKDYKVGLFYYAGHGLQIDGKNFLTGTDTNFFDSVSVKHTAVNLDEIIERMQVHSLEVKILVLDACRENPLPKMRNVTDTGLAPIYAPQGTIIAFSTSPGERARDFGSGRHSLYTSAFLEHIDDVNIPIEEFFKRVRTTVHAHSKGSQTSWEHTSLIGDFFFNSGQLIHSVNLPYKHEYIADALFVSSGSEFDEIILDMRSLNWYKQGPALNKFRKMKMDSLGVNELFLVGRNILQMAVGEERGSEQIVNHGFDDFLSGYFIGDENHLLNGVLFEIYFNSKGLFRQTKFKNKFIAQISHLQRNKKYIASFDFITAQLRPF
ncbi:MAG: peptidase C14, partial [Marivirga sp.]|nr:peptidase C14 [Marivirga sp.]